MEKEIFQYIKEKKLRLFEDNSEKSERGSIYKTQDGKKVHARILEKISSKFVFSSTKSILKLFSFSKTVEEVVKKQNFIKKIPLGIKNQFLTKIKKQKSCWKPNYSIITITEDEKTFNQLREIGCHCKYVVSQYDLDYLKDYEIVQVIECNDFSALLETLPQTVFIDSIEEAYLEKHLEILSAWKDNIEIIKNNETNEEISKIVAELSELFPLIENKKEEILTTEIAEKALDEINRKISKELEKLTISGNSIFMMLSKNSMPEEIKKIVRTAVEDSGLEISIFKQNVPVEIDYDELDKIIKKQTNSINMSTFKKIRKYSDKITKIQYEIERLQELLIMFDFCAGISNYKENAKFFPKISNRLLIENSKNILIENAEPISFLLDEDKRGSILTGANSGGKTTLLEHIIQVISLSHMGMPTNGNIELPLFSEIYYFAKNKGAIGRGAFETLLVQMSKIKPGKETLILADEIESVTEPGTAGSIIGASAEYFINLGCYLVFATHLGKEIQKKLPPKARIDGIEALGLDEKNELIVKRNPVLGKLANSTPELIIEKMAKAKRNDYLDFLNYHIKNKGEK